jgi:hypothetical protein
LFGVSPAALYRCIQPRDPRVRQTLISLYLETGS